jgi:hypothetical protein
LQISPGVVQRRHHPPCPPKLLALSCLGLALSEKQIPQIVENLESGYELKEALEPVAVRVKQEEAPRTASAPDQQSGARRMGLSYRPKNPPASGPTEPSGNPRRGSGDKYLPEFFQWNVSRNHRHIRRRAVNHQVRQEFW